MATFDLIEFLNTNSAHFVATVDNGQPRVRTLRVVRADRDGLLYSAPAKKDLVAHLKQTSVVEIAAFDSESGIQVRVPGDIEEVGVPPCTETES